LLLNLLELVLLQASASIIDVELKEVFWADSTAFTVNIMFTLELKGIENLASFFAELVVVRFALLLAL